MTTLTLADQILATLNDCRSKALGEGGDTRYLGDAIERARGVIERDVRAVEAASGRFDWWAAETKLTPP